ncbi:hypothetical protein ACEWY4_003066 [Coilia grayii]|uniref:SHSP domain-containing protein n=1 Tax=Coilia grayii TaxID=363190 RepID=A0ABD1KQ44_9TELE
MALSAFESIFKDDPFFEQASFVWPLQRTPLTSRLMQDVGSLREDFFSRRAHLVQSLRNEMRSSLLSELCQGLPAELIQGLEQLRSSSSSPASSSSPSPSPAPSTPTPTTPTPTPTSPMGLVSTTAGALQPTFNQDSTLTINAQGFTPDDIRVTVSGRQLEVMATRRAEAADSACMSNGTAHCASAAAHRRQQGFIQRVALPEGVEASDISCSLGEDGMLRIQTLPRRMEALEEPKVEQEEEVVADEDTPVRYRTSLDFPITKNSGAEATVRKST